MEEGREGGISEQGTHSGPEIARDACGLEKVVQERNGFPTSPARLWPQQLQPAWPLLLHNPTFISHPRSLRKLLPPRELGEEEGQVAR